MCEKKDDNKGILGNTMLVGLFVLAFMGFCPIINLFHKDINLDYYRPDPKLELNNGCNLSND